MRKKNTLIKRITCEYNELDTIAEILEEKAAEGWELSSKTGVIWGFRRSEPRKVKFCAEVVDTDVIGNALDEFISFCEADGWKHTFDAGSIQIFENEDLNAVPIHTEPEVKLRIVHDRCKVTRLLLPVGVLAFVIFFCWKELFPPNVYMLASWFNLFWYCIMPILGLLMGGMAVDYLCWYKKAKKAVETGKRPVYKRSNVSRYSDLFMVTVYIVGLISSFLADRLYGGDKQEILYAVVVFLVVMPAFIFGFIKLSAKSGKKKSNGFLYGLVAAVLVICVTIFVPGGFIFDSSKESMKMPLTQEILGLGETVSEGLYIEKEGTIFLQRMYGEDYSNGQELSYCVYSTKYEKIYEKLLQQEYLEADYYTFKEIKDDAFHAEKVYYDEEQNTWLLLYDNRIVELCEPQSLNDTQKTIFVQKLNDISA